MNLMGRTGYRVGVPLNNRAELVLINHRKGERAVKCDVPIAVVLIKHSLKCRAGVLENVVVQEHIALLHGDQSRIASWVFWRMPLKEADVGEAY